MPTLWQPNATTKYHVLVTDNAAHTAGDSITVVVNTPPAAPGPITGLQAICAGDTTTYSIVEVVGGTTYSWSVQGDAVILSGQNTPAISVKWGIASGPVQVIAGNNCGNNPLASVLPVTVNLPPVALNPVTGPDILCSGTGGTFTTTMAGPAATYSWTVPTLSLIHI